MHHDWRGTQTKNSFHRGLLATTWRISAIIIRMHTQATKRFKYRCLRPCSDNWSHTIAVAAQLLKLKVLDWKSEMEVRSVNQFSLAFGVQVIRNRQYPVVRAHTINHCPFIREVPNAYQLMCQTMTNTMGHVRSVAWISYGLSQAWPMIANWEDHRS